MIGWRTPWHMGRKLKRYFNTAKFLLDKDVRAFIRANRRFWRLQGSFSGGSRTILAEGRLISVYKALTYPALAATLAAAYNARVVYLFEHAHQLENPLVRLLSSFSRCEVVDIGSVLGPRHDETEAVVEELFLSLRTPADILDLRYGNMAIGEQVYDEVLFGNNMASVWKIDEKVRNAIRKAIDTREAILRLMEKHDIQAGIFTHATEAYHGIAARTLIQHQHPVFISFGGFGALKRYNRLLEERRGRLKAPVHLPPRLFQSLVSQHHDVLLQRAEEFLVEWNARADSPGEATTAEKNLYTCPEAFCHDVGLDPQKPCVFVMLHSLTDDPHVHEQTVFDDFYDWLMQTLEIAREVTDVNWVFKEHPLIGLYPDDIDRVGLFRILNCEHIIFLDENASFDSASLPHIAHAIVTCAGTAALEYTAQGVPGILAGRNHYAGHGLCEEPESLAEYTAVLQAIRHVARPHEQRQSKALVMFYLIYGAVSPGLYQGILPYRNRRHADAVRTSKQLIREATRRVQAAGAASLHEAVDRLVQFVSETEGSTNVEDLYLDTKRLGIDTDDGTARPDRHQDAEESAPR